MIKKDDVTGVFTVQYSERHPITRKVKTLRRRAATRAQAERTLKTLIAEVKASFEAQDRTMLWPDLLDSFYDHLRQGDLKAQTIENYSLCLDAHTRNRWEKRTVDSISTGEIRDLIQIDLLQKSRSHRKSMLKFIRAVFTFALEKRIMSVSPVPRLQFRNGKKFMKALTEDQAAKLLKVSKEMDHDWWRHWHFQVYTGMRNGESYALQKSNVDLSKRQIRVVESWTKKGGFVDLTKTGVDRVVEIAPPLIPVIQELLEIQINSPFLLPRIADWDSGRQAEVLRTFLAGLNLPQITFHNLRSTWATCMLSKGVPMAQVMKLGGWTSIKTLNEHYLRQTGIEIQGSTDNMIISATRQRA